MLTSTDRKPQKTQSHPGISTVFARKAVHCLSRARKSLPSASYKIEEVLDGQSIKGGMVESYLCARSDTVGFIRFFVYHAFDNTGDHGG